MLAKTFGAAVNGLDVNTITIETCTTEKFTVTYSGLGNEAVKEGLTRISSAFNYCQYHLTGRGAVVNLSPADLRKEGSGFDLPIAIGMLAAGGVMPDDHLHEYMLMGELGLDGSLKSIRGALPISILARKEGFRGLIVPKDNVMEAAVVNNLEVYGMENLTDVVQFLSDQKKMQPMELDTRKVFYEQQYKFELDFAEVRGQENVKRAMEVAASGGHNLIMIGPPGSGKSMMAKRLPGILPPLSLSESLETTQIHSVAGMLSKETSLISQRPFRAPHHTISQAALVGGGSTPQPGEISLAHNGVLFADELPEFSKATLEVLRQPLEDRKITIARAKYKVEFPCSFMFVASANPCPCGYYGDVTHTCTCSPSQRTKYLSRISGPLMDRIDIQCEIFPVPFSQISQSQSGEPSAAIRERVIKARKIQQERFKAYKGIHCNAQMTERLIHQFAEPDEEGRKVLQLAMTRLSLSARAYNRILKVARTIADIEGSPSVMAPHIQEAVSYRMLDRGDWAER